MRDRWLAEARVTRAIELASAPPKPGELCEGLIKDFLERSRMKQLMVVKSVSIA
jgi:hypothetical protein